MAVVVVMVVVVVVVVRAVAVFVAEHVAVAASAVVAVQFSAACLILKTASVQRCAVPASTSLFSAFRFGVVFILPGTILLSDATRP